VIHDKPKDEIYEVMNPLEKTRGLVHYRFFQNIARNAVEEQQQQREHHQENGNHQENSRPNQSSSNYNNASDSRSSYNYWNQAGKSSFPPASTRAGPPPRIPSANDYGPPRSATPQEDFGYDDYYDGQSEYSTQDQSQYHWEDGSSEYYNDQPAQPPRNEPLPLRQEVESEYGYESPRNDHYDERYPEDEHGVDDYYSTEQPPPTPPKQLQHTQVVSKNLTGALINENLSDIESCIVQGCTIQKEKWYFVLHSKTFGGRLDIIKRSYDDIWALQVTLLTRFPAESGHDGQSRTIPFLTPPASGASMMEASQIKFDLNRYFRELMILPSSLLTSSYFTKFFSIRPGDLQNTSISTDVADTLFDLLDDIQEQPEITIKITVDQESIAWREAPGLNWDELMYQAEDRLGFGVDYIYYLDETNALTPLYGDDDLALLISHSEKLEFYIK
jgi:hypothetical protein